MKYFRNFGIAHGDDMHSIFYGFSHEIGLNFVSSMICSFGQNSIVFNLLIFSILKLNVSFYDGEKKMNYYLRNFSQ